MRIKYEINYTLVDNIPYFDSNELQLIVEFEAFPEWENSGIGWNEFWGDVSFDKGVNYVSLEANGIPTWDESEHTEDENLIIRHFIESSEYKHLEDAFCEKYKKKNERY